METVLNAEENRLHDEEYWAEVIEELALEDEEDIGALLEEMIV